MSRYFCNGVIRIFCFGLLLLSPALRAQEESSSKHFAIIFYGGATTGTTTWRFLSAKDRFPVYSHIAVSGGLMYGPVISALGSDVNISLEIGYGSIKTDESDIILQLPFSPHYGQRYLAEMEIQRIPVMFWVTMISTTKLSPFIRVGAGMSKSDFRESYSFPEGPSFSFNRWAFTWGIGGGLNLNVSPTYSVGVFLDDWITSQDLLETLSSGIQNGLEAPFKLTIIGIKGMVRL